MQRKRRSKSTLRTDRNTDHMFEYFFNENKFNSQLKEEWDDQMEKKLQDHQNRKNDPAKIASHQNRHQDDSKTSESRENNNASTGSWKNGERPSAQQDNKNYDFADTESEVSEKRPDEQFGAYSSGSESLSQSVASDRKKRRRGKTFAQTEHSYFSKKHDNIPPKGYGKPHDEFYPPPPDTRPPMNAPAPPPPKYETPEERRSRQRIAYAQLQKLQKDHKVSLTREFNQYDDPDDMEEEYRLHRDQKKKEVSVNTYGRALLTIISLVELANTKFDPFSIKLDGWSTQFGSEMDEHREILEELYEKYKGKGGGYPPEIRLAFAIVFSAITFHLSQLFMGSESLKSIINGNPAIFNRVYSEVANQNEPTPVQKGPMDSQSILERIKLHNKRKQAELSQTATVSLTETQTSTSAPPKNSPKNNRESQEKQENLQRQLEQMKLRHEQEMMRQAYIHNQQMAQLNQQSSSAPTVHTAPPVVATATGIPKNLFQSSAKPVENPVNRVLSELNVSQQSVPKIVINDAAGVEDDPFANIENVDEAGDFQQIFDSEAGPRSSSEKSHKLNELDDILNIISDSSVSESLTLKTDKKPKSGKTQSIRATSLTKTSSLSKGGSGKKVIRL